MAEINTRFEYMRCVEKNRRQASTNLTLNKRRQKTEENTNSFKKFDWVSHTTHQKEIVFRNSKIRQFDVRVFFMYPRAYFSFVSSFLYFLNFSFTVDTHFDSSQQVCNTTSSFFLTLWIHELKSARLLLL